ncbi:MAG: DUF6452 family protein [Candidatus Amulumruptor caecigallinarius]|nr:DUF6452 family protein [Candidatus Amulumruptor caecigallinarius]MCM1397562.1 DUF6452 family protein [Candidatus Amulumruptor caecigallinarius]MCM1454464.1 DUF6452 family protein [bacterium]
MATASCSNDICTENQNSVPKAQFVNTALDTQIAPDTIAIMGVGAPNDSLLYSAGTRLTDIYLPLRPNFETTSYLFHYTSRDVTDPDTGEVTEDHSGDDIIVFSYTSTPFFSGADCGAMYRYYISEIRHTTHGIEMIIIEDPVVINTDKVRIYIALKEPPKADDDSTDDDTGDGSDSDDNTDASSSTDAEVMSTARYAAALKGGASR